MLDTSQFELRVTPCFYSIDPVAVPPPASTAAESPPEAEASVWVNVPCPYTRELVVHAVARSVSSQAGAPFRSLDRFCSTTPFLQFPDTQTGGGPG